MESEERDWAKVKAKVFLAFVIDGGGTVGFVLETTADKAQHFPEELHACCNDDDTWRLPKGPDEFVAELAAALKAVEGKNG